MKKIFKKIGEDLTEYKIGRTNLADVMAKSGLFLVLLIVLPLLFSSERTTSLSDMRVGNISTRKIVAPFNFYILKTDKELGDERDSVIEKVPYYFAFNDSIFTLQQNQLLELLPFLDKNRPTKIVDDSTEILWNQELLRLKEILLIEFKLDITAANLNVLYNLMANRQNRRNLQTVSTELLAGLQYGVVNLNLDQIKRNAVIVLRQGIEEQTIRDRLLTEDTLRTRTSELLLTYYSESQLTILNIFFGQIIQPNVMFDRQKTLQVLDEAINGVSLTKDMVFKDELIVDENLRIDEATFQKLISLEYSQMENSRRQNDWQDVMSYTGKMALLAVILFVFGLYLYSFRRKILANNKKLLLISLIVLLQAIAAAIITEGLEWPMYVIPTTISAMLLAILIDSGIAFTGTIVIGLLFGGIHGGGYEVVLYTIVAGMFGIFAVHKIRTRNQVFRAILFITLAYVWVIFSLSAIRFESATETLRIFVYYLLPNAVLSAFITFMILGIFEKLFDITTDVTLLELSDLNHSLLKRLSLEAPGTFHHSLVVGNLSEAAAKAIGANALLARVGSYYHDVGKMEKPEYFIENQMDADNRHNQLAPSMSALILASHVKNGIELAKKYGIPELIRNFIPEHHGTNLMTYFYSRAIQANPDIDLNEADFRYPGPKPQTKETGIVMLADAVEAASRTIKNPTPSKVRAFVEDLVDLRFKDGELDDCDLTLKDLKNITGAFLPILLGVFQHRIEYPDADKKKTDSKKNGSKKSKEKNEDNNSSKTAKN